MTKREVRVINAFINCVKSGEFTGDYAIALIEDQQKYGWLSEEAKEIFYEEIDFWQADHVLKYVGAPAGEDYVEEEPVEEIVDPEIE